MIVRALTQRVRFSFDPALSLVPDARGLWRLHGRELDAERIRETLRLLEEALGQSDLLPSFESIVRRR